MSKEQEDQKRIKEMTRRAIKSSVFIMAPLMMGLAFTSNNVIELLLTEKWLPCVPFLCIFCITSMFYPIHTANLNAIKALGRSDLFLKLEIIKKVIGIILLIATMNISVMAMAYSLLINSVISQIINSWPNKKLLGYSYLSQLKDILPSIILAVFMGGIVYLVNYIGLGIVITLIIQVIIGIIVYVGLARFWRFESYFYVLDSIKKLIKKKKS